MGDRKYYVTSIILAIISSVAFFISFENRKPQAKEIIIIAVMSAIGAVSRMAFIWVPFFKPLAAVVIVSGVALGAQAGFLCGALSVFVSNFTFGQGTWTPIQMLAFGICGFVSGLIFSNKEKYSKEILSIYGAIIVLVLTGPSLDLIEVLSQAQSPDITAITASLGAGFHANTIQAVATAFFLWITAEPMLEKLQRIKIKYGMMK